MARLTMIGRPSAARHFAGRSGQMLGLALALGACSEEVPLGAWDLTSTSTGQADTSGSGSGSDSISSATGASGSGGTGTATVTGSGVGGSAGDGSDDPVLPACLAEGVPGAFNARGATNGATETATDWTWPSPVTSMEWDLMVEREITPSPGLGVTPTSGYYWAHQFRFLEGVVGFLGIQANGGYQEDPPESDIYWEKIAVFWLSGPAVAGELGDIPAPDARVAPATAAGVDYLTIHARFDWQICHNYHFRLAPAPKDGDQGTWYGAWINDTTAGIETYLGRMQLPADSGPLSAFSTYRSIQIDFLDNPRCDEPEPASALFGTPVANGGTIVPMLGTDRFGDPLMCATSRFSDFPDFPSARRHENAVRP